jgi:hypothetical protein
MPNPIKGSDLYQDDGALDGAIKKLEQFINKFEEATATVQQKAQAQARAIKESNTAQDRNVEAQAQAAKEADKLARAYQRYKTSLSDAGREMARLKEQQRRQNTLLRNQARAAASAEGSYDRLAAQYNLNKIRLNAMSREQREAAEASSQLVTRTRQLFEEMKRLQAETGKTALNVGNYADSLKDAFRETIGLGAGALGPAAIGAALAGGLAAGTQAAIELAEEIRNVKGALSTLVGPNEDLEGLTTRVRALATTFDESTGEITQAANAVSKQLGITFDDALGKLEESFVAGSNLNGELLESAKEYSAFFAEAGLGANALFQTIQNGTQNGIFNDKAIDSVKEVTLRLREMPKATAAALEGIGLASEDITRLIETEGIGSAIATVSERLGELKADSPEVGRAIADIFGGPGEDAGLQYLISLQNINKATGELIDESNEYQQQQARLLELNQDLADAQNDLIEAFGGTGTSIEEVKTQGQELLIRALIPIIESGKELFSTFEGVVSGLNRLGDAISGTSTKAGTLETAVRGLTTVTDLLIKPVKSALDFVGDLADKFGKFGENVRGILEDIGVLDEKLESTGEAGAGMGRFNRQAAEDLAKLDAQAKKTESLRTRTTQTKDLEEKSKAAAGSLADLRMKVSDLKKEIDQSDPGEAAGLLPKLLDAEQALKDLETFNKRYKQQLEDAKKGFGVVDTITRTQGFETSVTSTTTGGLPTARDIIPPGAANDQPQDIFDLLGFDIPDGKKEAIADAFSFAKQQVTEFFALRTQLATQRAQEATEEVRQAEAALQAEVSREEQGLASRVDLRQRELQQAQANQRKALEEQRKAERAQRRIQTVEQAGNLVTASSKIFAQLGFPAALPAIALMFGTFAATKIQAARATRRNLRHGKYEVMNYGTAHGFGGDIPLGLDNDGRANYAERGEGLMVVPAVRASQYKGVLPSMFKAIQAGKLHRWIDTMSEQQRGAINVMTGQPMDTSRMEGSLEKIAGNTGRQVYTDGNGNTVVKEGNFTTTYRK